MAHVRVTVLKPLTYQGRSYVRGETLEGLPVDLAILARAGKVDLTKRTYQTASVHAEPLSEPDKPKRRYRRRDMTAEQT